jgi:hypothetical protein
MSMVEMTSGRDAWELDQRAAVVLQSHPCERFAPPFSPVCSLCPLHLPKTRHLHHLPSQRDRHNPPRREPTREPPPKRKARQPQKLPPNLPNAPLYAKQKSVVS